MPTRKANRTSARTGEWSSAAGVSVFLFAVSSAIVLLASASSAAPIPTRGLTSSTSGSIVAWGLNDSGQCDVPSPNTGFVALAAGLSHSLGLKSDGSIMAWGDNYWGQCSVPFPNADFVAVAACWCNSLGLKRDRSIMAWGNNSYGQCNVPSPNTDFVAMAAGAFHNLGLKRDGSIVAWGDNYYGQCNIPSPNTGFVAVAAGYRHSLGLKRDGSIVAWGDNYYGQRNVPSPNTGFVAVAAGNVHNLARMALRYSRMAHITRLRQTIRLDPNDNDLLSDLTAIRFFSGFSWCRDFIAVLGSGFRSASDHTNDRISAFYDYLSAIPIWP